MELIQPVQRGETLLNDIHTYQPGASEVALWWLGQSGYAIKTVSLTFYVDLYLSEHLTAKYADTPKPHIRMTESPIRGSDLTGVMNVFSSHKHSDHLDPGTMPDLFKASPGAKLALPSALIEHAVGMGLNRDRLIATRGDDVLQLGHLTVHSLPSAHPNLDYSEENGYPFLGFVFKVDGLTLYHSGDTVIYDGLVKRLRQHNIDIAFLPINGTDEKRLAGGTPPNMSMTDALNLAQEVGVKLVIPHHYDMFTFNTADVTEFAALATERGVNHAVLQCGERFTWSK